MAAPGLDPVGRGRNQALDVPFGETVFLTVYLDIGYIAGSSERDEHNKRRGVFRVPFHFRDGFPLGGHTCNLHSGQKG